MIISYVIPCYQRLDWLRLSLRANLCYRCPGSEVVLVLDEPSEETKAIALAKETPSVKFRIIVNDWEHQWRPPCIPINVGVRHAEGSHIAILSPETMLSLPMPDYLERLIAEDWRPTYGGLLWHFADADKNDPERLIRTKFISCQQRNAPDGFGYGFILCQKFAFEQICGFDERRVSYGGDDDDIRIRLLRLGVPTVIDPCIHIFHAWHNSPGNRSHDKEPASAATVLYHQKETWGRAFNRVIWDHSKQ